MVEVEAAVRKQCLGKGSEKALANKGDIAGTEQEMARESGTANDPQMTTASKAVVGESSVADLGCLKDPEVCRRVFWKVLPGWERQAAHRLGMAFCIAFSFSVARE